VYGFTGTDPAHYTLRNATMSDANHITVPFSKGQKELSTILVGINPEREVWNKL